MKSDSKWNQMTANFRLLPYLKLLICRMLMLVVESVEAKNKKIYV